MWQPDEDKEEESSGPKRPKYPEADLNAPPQTNSLIENIRQEVTTPAAEVVPAPEKAPKYLDPNAGQPPPEAPPPAPVWIPPTYAEVGTDQYKPHTRVIEGQELPQIQIGSETKTFALNPNEVTADDDIAGYDWQPSTKKATDFGGGKAPSPEILKQLSSPGGYTDESGQTWQLTSDANGKPVINQRVVLVNKEVPIMGTSAEKSIMAQNAASEAVAGSLSAQARLEEAKLKAEQDKEPGIRASEDEILKREQRRNTNLDIATSHYSQLVSELEDQKVNPSRQFQKLTPAGRMARVVYLFTAGMRGPEYLKLAMDQLNADVDRDIDAQKQAIAAKKDRVNGQLQVISNMRNLYDNERDADNAMHAVTLRRVQTDMEAQLAEAKTEATRAALTASIATVSAEAAKYELDTDTATTPVTRETQQFDPRRTVQTSPGRYVLPPGSDPIQNLQNEAAAILANPNRTSKDQARYDWIMKALAGSKEDAPKKSKAQTDAEDGIAQIGLAEELLARMEAIANKPNPTREDWYAFDSANKAYTKTFARLASNEALSEAELKGGALPNAASWGRRTTGLGREKPRDAIAGARAALGSMRSGLQAKAGQAPPPKKPYQR
jgi:hypothetical protein